MYNTYHTSGCNNNDIISLSLHNIIILFETNIKIDILVLLGLNQPLKINLCEDYERYVLLQWALIVI